jgi:small multidrug resistance pump
LSYLYLAIAIVSEVIGTVALKASEEFTRPVPSLIMALGYASAFYFLTLTLRTIPVGIAYAIWSGCGVVLICAISWILFRQSLDAPAILGIGLIAVGVVVINAFSGASTTSRLGTPQSEVSQLERSARRAAVKHQSIAAKKAPPSMTGL